MLLLRASGRSAREGDACAVAGEQGLTIRHTQREEIALPCVLEIASGHSPLVRLTGNAAATRGRIDATVIDASEGGLGVLSPVFLPKRALVRVRVRHPVAEDQPPLLEATLRVQRVVMTDRRPYYLIGFAYAQADDAEGVAVERFLARLGERADA